MDVIQFLSAFGLGAIITTAVQAWLSMNADNAKRNFQEKKEAYVGLLDALHQSELAQTEVASKYVGHWMSRIELVGLRKVMVISRLLSETNPFDGHMHPDRPKVMHDLKEAMRKDLGVAS